MNEQKRLKKVDTSLLSSSYENKYGKGSLLMANIEAGSTLCGYIVCVVSEYNEQEEKFRAILVGHEYKKIGDIGKEVSFSKEVYTWDKVCYTEEPLKPVVDSDKKILCLIYDTDNGKAVSFANTTTVDDEHEIVEAITVYDDGGKYPVGSVLKYDDFINGLANHRQNSYVGHTEVETSTYHSYLKDINEAKAMSVGDVVLITAKSDIRKDPFLAIVRDVNNDSLECFCVSENCMVSIGEKVICPMTPNRRDRWNWSPSTGKELGEIIDSYSKKAKAIRSIDENEIPF